MVLNFQKLFERVGVLEDDKYRLAKYHIFGQAAVAVRDKVLEPDVFAASGGIVHTWQDLQKALLMKPARKQEKLVNVPDTVVDNLKTRHPIVKPLDFMQLIKFIHAHNRFAHRSLTEVSDVNELVEDMRAFMFKPKDPDAKLGAALLDIVVEKADKIVARSKADVIAWSPAAARSQASTPSTATDATVPHGGFGLQPIMYEEDMV